MSAPSNRTLPSQPLGTFLLLAVLTLANTAADAQTVAPASTRAAAAAVSARATTAWTLKLKGKGNVLLQIDKDSAQPRARVDLGKEKEPVYAVDDIAGMLFLRTSPGTLVGYRL